MTSSIARPRFRLKFVHGFALAATVAAVVGTALACGPYFSVHLNDRKNFLRAPVVNNFYAAVATLRPTPETKVPTKVALDFASTSSTSNTSTAQPTAAEYMGLTAAQIAQVKTMRQQTDGNSAYAKGADLPPALRLYTAAAVDFQIAGGRMGCEDSVEESDVVDADPQPSDANSGEGAAPASPVAAPAPQSANPNTNANPSSNSNVNPNLNANKQLCSARVQELFPKEKELFDKARKRFEAVLQLPEKERSLRATWAAYSLGLIDINENKFDQAAQHFALTQKLAAQDAPDPQLLGLESFGTLALAYLRQNNYVRAIELYADQAALAPDAPRMGNPGGSGGESLVIVANMLLNDKDALRHNIQQPIVQRLLINYLLAYGGDATAPALGLGQETAYSQDSGNGANQAHKPTLLLQVVQALQAAGIAHPADADKLAAAAYAQARYDIAKRYLADVQTPLAFWLRAKLALMAGDNKAAAAAFASALHAQQPSAAGTEKPSAAPSGATLLLPDQARELAAQFAALQLGNNEFVQALELLYAQNISSGTATEYLSGADYWIDTAYVAERLVTTDELKKFVDTHVPKAAPVTEPYQFHPDVSMRNLLARRLMREKRYDEALDYFQDIDLPKKEDGSKDEQPRVYAKAYSEALHAATKAWTQVGKAQSLYQAADIARWHGMEILGYELAPDFGFIGGNYDIPDLAPQSDPKRSTVEQERVRASAAEFADKRYHYRYLAVQLAGQAADHLPVRSRAYADVLSNAALWIRYQDPAIEKTLYQRYRSTGAHIKEAGWTFAKVEHAPDFSQARHLQWRQTLTEARLWARHHKPLVWGVLVAGLLGLVFLGRVGLRWWRRRREQVHA